MKKQSLRAWREDKHLTQEQLEALCAKTATAIERNIQLTQTAISNIEIGRVVNPKWDTVTVLAEALAIDPRQISFNTDAEKQSRLPLRRKAS